MSERTELTSTPLSREQIITEIKLFPTERQGKTLAYANITLMNMFVVKNLRIVQGNKGVFIGMPSIKRKDGEHRDIFFPINTEARNMITELLVEAYKAETGQEIE